MLRASMRAVMVQGGTACKRQGIYRFQKIELFEPDLDATEFSGPVEH